MSVLAAPAIADPAEIVSAALLPSPARPTPSPITRRPHEPPTYRHRERRRRRRRPRLTITRTYRAPVDDVWAAITESERVRSLVRHLDR